MIFMRKIREYLDFFFSQIFAPLFGLEVKSCYVIDQAKHVCNQKLLKEILEGEIVDIAHLSPYIQARQLTARIRQIAKKMMESGFMPEAYAVPKAALNSVLAYHSFSLWEGLDNAQNLPLTFFVYVWPSKELALEYHASSPENFHYASNIHRHPISCAFAVLQGSLIEKTFVELDHPSKKVELSSEKVFHVGEGDVDDLSRPFIHQVYCAGDSSSPALSLHVYGLSSKDEVWDTFRKTRKDCSYQLSERVFTKHLDHTL